MKFLPLIDDSFPSVTDTKSFSYIHSIHIYRTFWILFYSIRNFVELHSVKEEKFRFCNFLVYRDNPVKAGFFFLAFCFAPLKNSCSNYCSIVLSLGELQQPRLAAILWKLQNCTARILTFPSNDANADDLFNRLGWHTATVVYTLNHWMALHFKICERKLAFPLPRTNFEKKKTQLQKFEWCSSLEQAICQAKH